jgi:hypothetical protein
VWRYCKPKGSLIARDSGGRFFFVCLSTVLLLKAFDTAGGIDKLLFARKERMANRADFNVDLVPR